MIHVVNDWLGTFVFWSVILVVCYIVLALLIHIPSLLRPTIIHYPWPLLKEKEDVKVALAGSYNPPHRGHLAMLLYLSKRYTHVLAILGVNPVKQYQVSPETRAALLRKMLQEAGVTNVQVQVVQGYIWRSAKRQGVRLFFRGIRSWSQDGREERHLQFLNIWGPLLYGPLVWPIPTRYLEGKPEYNHVSSTLVRDILGRNDDSQKPALQQLVPDCVVHDITRLYGSIKES
ncbi:hypothetical protein FisN_22Lh043 [Fistulifera solaris]|uniref:Phosphopantetheine adenylyltransferase n=1 Tax=Fistulifera solaris TaxID=1519565 RepID=A0A1Z5JBJ5_FISSO|nr:hypothetical protein FisN_22Lh043 [Fistulifera solaris]|eukprot:GAX11373.1 hypothetical protein FisN_22Lh043 [Fistulifera solaris]